MKVEIWKTKQVKPYEKNPRINDKAVNAVVESIKEFGFRQPIVVDEQGVIIAGHTRYKAAKRLKLPTVPVTVAEGLTPSQIAAYRLADNKTHELSEWNMELLNMELEELRNDCEFTLDMAVFGFEQDISDSEETKQSKEVMIPELFQIVVDCEDEEDQHKCYDELVAAGRNCKCISI